MPIRFRCVYCNQLMGIARRKAGMVVRCPSCASQVTVPASEGTEKDDPEPAAPLFERSDFDELFNPGGVRTRPAAPPPPFYNPPAPPLSPGPADFPRAPEALASNPDRGGEAATTLTPNTSAASKPGIWVTPGIATLVCVGVIVGLALAFVAGLLVGALLKPANQESRLRERPSQQVLMAANGFVVGPFDLVQIMPPCAKRLPILKSRKNVIEYPLVGMMNQFYLRKGWRLFNENLVPFGAKISRRRIL